MAIWIKLNFNPSNGSEEDFQRFPDCQPETIAFILDVRQCHWTEFWKGTVQGVTHPS